jgi:hypothetical protein
MARKHTDHPLVHPRGEHVESIVTCVAHKLHTSGRHEDALVFAQAAALILSDAERQLRVLAARYVTLQ